VLKRLFKYPPVEDVHLFVEKALELYRQSIITPTSIMLPSANNQNNNIPPIISDQFNHKGAQSSKVGIDTKAITSTVKSVLLGDTEKIEKLERTIEQIKLTQTHMSQRLERIIFSLQKEIVEKSDSELSNLVSINRDSLLVSIAELKQVKDILSGLLPEHLTPATDLDPLAAIPTTPVNRRSVTEDKDRSSLIASILLEQHLQKIIEIKQNL